MVNYQFACTKNILLSCLMALIILATGCGQIRSSLPSMDASGFDTWVEIFNQTADKVVQLRDHYDPDLVSTLTVGGQVDQELKSLSLAYPDAEARLDDTYLSRHGGFVVADSWNWAPLPTGEAWTEDHPFTEYDWIAFFEGKISDWQVLYGQELLAAAGLPLDQAILQDYATAWSSGEPGAVSGLYTPDAIRYEPLLWGDKEGGAQIEEFSRDFFSEFPGARYELLQSFGELPEAGHLGGIFAIHLQKFLRMCDVRAIIVLEPDNGKIAREWAFYQADSLFDCGWVR